MKSYWRRHARAAIEAALRSGWAAGLDGVGLMRHVDAACPFGPHDRHGLFVWMDEYARLVEGKPLPTCNPRLIEQELP